MGIMVAAFVNNKENLYKLQKEATFSHFHIIEIHQKDQLGHMNLRSVTQEKQLKKNLW